MVYVLAAASHHALTVAAELGGDCRFDLADGHRLFAACTNAKVADHPEALSVLMGFEVSPAVEWFDPLPHALRSESGSAAGASQV
jgi:hypothetical protein